MEKNDFEFLLRYAKVGILKTMEGLDPIASEELKQEYIRIKRELFQVKPSNRNLPVQSAKNKEERPSAIKKWFNGIGERQKKYKEENEGGLI